MICHLIPAFALVAIPAAAQEVPPPPATVVVAVNTLEGRGLVYFTTEATPPPGGEDTGTFTPREKALMARALTMLAVTDD